MLDLFRRFRLLTLDLPSFFFQFTSSFVECMTSFADTNGSLPQLKFFDASNTFTDESLCCKFVNAVRFRKNFLNYLEAEGQKEDLRVWSNNHLAYTKLSKGLISLPVRSLPLLTSPQLLFMHVFTIYR